GLQARDRILRSATLAHRIRVARVVGGRFAAQPPALECKALEEGDAGIARQALVEGIELREGAGVVAQAEPGDAGELYRLRLLRVDRRGDLGIAPGIGRALLRDQALRHQHIGGVVARRALERRPEVAFGRVVLLARGFGLALLAGLDRRTQGAQAGGVVHEALALHR